MRYRFTKTLCFGMVALSGVAFLTAVYFCGCLMGPSGAFHLFRQVSAAESPGGAEGMEAPSRDESRLVRAMRVTAEPDSRSAVYPGEVRGRYESTLGFLTGGRVLERKVRLGDSVRAGDTLMTLDPKDLQEALKASEAQVQAAASQLRLAEDNFNRFNRLYLDKAAPKVQLDQARTGYEVALAASRQAEAMREQCANQLDYSCLRTEKAGVISGLMAEVGQVIAPGQPVAVLVQDGDREVEINVPENRVDALRKAVSIAVSFWALPGVSTEGELREIAPMADPVLRTYKVRVRLVTPPEELALGMTSSVRIVENNEGARAKQVPLSAIYQVGDTPNVWVVIDDTVHPRPVELDGYGEDTVRVTSGLEDGDIVVTAGVHKLLDGQKVQYRLGDTL